MDILLLRHGEAAEAAGALLTDEARPLTESGRERLAQACATYAQIAPFPRRLLASPLLRAQQSAVLLADAFGTVSSAPDVEECRELTPVSRPARMLERLHAEALEGTDSIAIVGHEPHLGSLFGLLLTGTEQYPLPLHKGMLVWIRLDSPHTMLGRVRLCLTQADAATLRDLQT